MLSSVCSMHFSQAAGSGSGIVKANGSCMVDRSLPALNCYILKCVHLFYIIVDRSNNNVFNKSLHCLLFTLF